MATMRRPRRSRSRADEMIRPGRVRLVVGWAPVPMVLTSHGAAQMAHWSRCRLRRTRRADVCGAAVADVFPRATAYTARYGRPPGSPGGRTRYQGRREGDRLAHTAARRKAGGAVFSRQWRRVARPTEAGLIADAEAAYAFAVEHYPAERIVLWGESLGSGVAVALGDASQGGPHGAGRILYLGCRCGRACLSVFASATFDEGAISLRSANR